MLVIRKAEETEYGMVRGFYHQLIDLMQHAAYSPGWEKEVYPSNDYLQQSISRGEMYVGFAGERIAAAMIVNHTGNESYANAAWPTQAADNEVTVIHALGVHPACSGKGYAKQLVQYVLSGAQAAGQRAVRLDVLRGNLPAEKLYTGLGFQYVDTIQMFYEDTGWTDYMLYEYPLA